MSADDIPVDDEDNLDREDCAKQENKRDSYSQNGNYGIGHANGVEIKDDAKVAREINENSNNKSQNANIQVVNVNTNTSSEANSSKKQDDLIGSQNTIEMYIKEGDKEASIKTPYSEENFQSLMGFLQQRFNDDSLGYKDVKKSSIKLVIEGSENGLRRIVESFASGELAPVLRQQFNLELEDAKLIDSNGYENYPKNQSQKLLAFTIAGNVSQADIDVLKAALVDTSNNDEEIKNQEKSRLIKEIRNRGAKDKNLSGAYLIRDDPYDVDLRGADLYDADLGGANLSSANLSGAHLIRANLRDANLRDANLSGAYLIRANLYGADLGGVNLSNANLSNANLSNANLSNANLYGANLNNPDLSGANLSNIDLSGANLSNVDLSGARLVQANLIRSQLNNAKLVQANLIGADLRNAELLEADLTDADLSGAKVENARFGYNLGISESLRRNLINRKATFEDTPDEPSKVYSPAPTRV